MKIKAIVTSNISKDYAYDLISIKECCVDLTDCNDCSAKFSSRCCLSYDVPPRHYYVTTGRNFCCHHCILINCDNNGVPLE